MSEPHFNGPFTEWAYSAFADFRQPDPWPEEVDRAARDSAAVPLCTNCLFPQGPHRWFCPNCSFPTGDCVTLLPLPQVLVVGEVLRQGVAGPPERRAGVQLFLVIFAFYGCSFFAPLYWFWMYRRSIGKPIARDYRPAWDFDETT